jgi:hypothetical protein
VKGNSKEIHFDQLVLKKKNYKQEIKKEIGYKCDRIEQELA